MKVETIQYLSADYPPTNSQSPEGIKQLVQELASYELTKAEKLQVINLSPTLPVELYVIVEELEDRFDERMEDILSHIQSAFTQPPTTAMANGELYSLDVTFKENHVEQWGSLTYLEQDEEIIFDDTGEGAGVEGDLDMDED